KADFPRTTLKRIRPEELYHRFEPIGNWIHLDWPDLIVTAYTDKPLEPRSECTHYIIVNIPGPHTKCFTGVEYRPRIGRLKSGQIEQTLINNSKRISH